MRKKKGFTLIELVIVIAIIGILTAILIPSWGYYLQRSRTRTQNGKAKTIFNAAQTVVTDMKIAERRYYNIYTDPASTHDEKNEALKHLYSTPGANEWYFYWNGTAGTRVGDGSAVFQKTPAGDWTAERSDYADEWTRTIGNTVHRILDDDTIFKIYVKDYQVMSVVSARFDGDSYLGAYPTNLDKLDEYNQDVSSIRETGTRDANMALFDLDVSDVTGP